MIGIGAEHRIGSRGRWDKCNDKKKKDDTGAIRSNAVTHPPVFVHGLPQRNPYWVVIGREDKCCESGLPGG